MSINNVSWLQTYCKEEGGVPALPTHLEMFVRANFLHSPDLGEAEWCFSFPPVAYSHVQDKYWDVSDAAVSLELLTGYMIRC